MRIIYNGDVSRLKKTKRFECKYCGCIFEADAGEYAVESWRNVEYYKRRCPTCGNQVCTSEDETEVL